MGKEGVLNECSFLSVVVVFFLLWSTIVCVFFPFLQQILLCWSGWQSHKIRLPWRPSDLGWTSYKAENKGKLRSLYLYRWGITTKWNSLNFARDSHNKDLTTKLNDIIMENQQTFSCVVWSHKVPSRPGEAKPRGLTPNPFIYCIVSKIWINHKPDRFFDYFTTIKCMC